MEMTPETQKHNLAILKAVNDCQNYFFNTDGNKPEIAGFDSIATEQQKRPEVLNAIFDSIDEPFHGKVDQAVNWGIRSYQERNGGSLPHASVIASALSAGLTIAQDVKGNKEVAGFDDVSNLNYEQASIVPALTVVTIANVIANALPMVAMLPNVNNSVRIPVVSVRLSTDKDFGAMLKGEFIDGDKAGLPYAEGRFKFALTSTDQKTYNITAYTQYADYTKRTPNTDSTLLPFLGANVSIRINGKEVGHTRSDRGASVMSGIITAQPHQKKAVIKGTEYRLVSSSIDLDKSTISATFDKALPTDAVVEVALVADFDKKDAKGKDYLIDPVGVSFVPDYDDIQAVPSTQQIHLNFNVQSQLANELGFGFMATALASIQGKMFLEQNIRLLGECKDRALYNERVSTFDITRGVAGGLTASYNTTTDLMGEFAKFLNKAKLKIRQASGGSTVRFDAFVGDNGLVFFNQMSRDKFTPTGLIASYGEIVRIGTLSDGTDVYHSPTNQGLIVEGDTTTEVLVTGRGSEPVRNPIVGSMVIPPTIRTAGKDTREALLGVHTEMASELNPLDRYADQNAVIKIIGLVNLDA